MQQAITLFLSLIFFIQVFCPPPPKKNFPCGNFYALTGKMRKGHSWYVPGHFPQVYHVSLVTQRDVLLAQ